jgi:serine phosphatase RsbU (regulator of sigma subunit)
MVRHTKSSLDLATLLKAVEDAAPVAAADVVAGALADAVGASHVSFLIADFSGSSLMRLGHTSPDDGEETAKAVPLEGTPHGRVMATQAVEVVAQDEGVRLLAPVSSRGEAIGLLELQLDEEPDDDTVQLAASAAHALAYVIIANRRYTDLFEWGQRSRPLSLPAEIQHRLLPAAYTCEGGQFTLAAWLEPTGEVGGDTFDFSLERNLLHVSITDAMGHGLESSLLATVVVGALRNARRRGVELSEQVAAANEALVDHATHGQFVTGQVFRVDLAGESAGVVNAGHPPPLRMREGQVQPVQLRPDPPFGASRATAYGVQNLSLRAGDRLLFVTDGMLEGRAANIDLAECLADGAGLHPREAVQALTTAVLDANGGELRDDAAALCLDWHGGTAHDRHTKAGTDS